MPADSIRLATHDDVDRVAALAAARRREYEVHQARFWRQAGDALARHTAHLHGLVDAPDHIFLVSPGTGRLAGFVVGRLVPAPPVYEPGGDTCLIDDFAVAHADDWSTTGLALLRNVSRLAAARGAAQVVVVTGRHDTPKRKALDAAGLVPASEWWTAPIDDA